MYGNVWKMNIRIGGYLDKPQHIMYGNYGLFLVYNINN